VELNSGNSERCEAVIACFKGYVRGGTSARGVTVGCDGFDCEVCQQSQVSVRELTVFPKDSSEILSTGGL